jgi:hypothetical protein
MLVPRRVERFWAAVPRPFLERFLRSVFDCYKTTEEFCQEFDKPERENLRPFLRREHIEGSFRRIANQFPENVRADAVRFDGFWYHTRVICNDDVAITQNSVRDPGVIVPNSWFRSGYSQPYNQRYLFPEMTPDKVPSESLLYGILLHGRSIENPRIPGFAQVRFPMPNLTGYYEEKIDLFGEFSEVVRENVDGVRQMPSEEPDIEPELIESVIERAS